MPTVRPARIFVVDDSAVVRSLLRAAILSDSSLELAGTAADGASALGMIDSLHPDLILLDVEMPVLDGVATLRRLRERGYRTPVIMCSALTRRGARVTVDALASGASDYVAKPDASSGSNVPSFVQDLLRKIKALVAPAKAPSAAIEPAIYQAISAIPSVVLLGVSTGGPAALHTVLPEFPASFPLPILVVQHMPELFTRMLAERLARSCRLPVSEATHGEAVVPGRIFIAPGNWHMEIAGPTSPGSSAKLRLSQTPSVNHCRPAADVLFRSAAAVYGSGVLAAVLTGMGADGLAGARAIRAQGGTVLAQDEGTSLVWGMPGAVVQAALAQRILPLSLIGPELLRLASKSRAFGRELREKVAS